VLLLLLLLLLLLHRHLLVETEAAVAVAVAVAVAEPRRGHGLAEGVEGGRRDVQRVRLAAAAGGGGASQVASAVVTVVVCELHFSTFLYCMFKKKEKRKQLRGKFVLRVNFVLRGLYFVLRRF
jgi:hypothetical protein